MSLIKRPSGSLIRSDIDDIFSYLYKDMGRVFDNFLTDNFESPVLKKGKYWNPKVNLKETPKEFILTAELPGFKKEDVHVSFEDNVLILKGEKKEEEEKKEEKSHLNERFYGYFERSFQLPEKRINQDKIAAQFTDGVLKVMLEKRIEVEKESRKIEIK